MSETDLRIIVEDYDTGTTQAIYASVLELVEGNGTARIDSPDGEIVDPISATAILVFLLGGSATVAAIVHRLFHQFRPLTIIDIRSNPPEVTLRRDAPGMRGKILVINPEGVTHEWVDDGSGVDLTAFAKAISGDS